MTVCPCLILWAGLWPWDSEVPGVMAVSCRGAGDHQGAFLGRLVSSRHLQAHPSCPDPPCLRDTP